MSNELINVNITEEENGQLSFLEKKDKTIPEFIKFVNSQIKILFTEIDFYDKNIYYKNQTQSIHNTFYQFVSGFVKNLNLLSEKDKKILLETETYSLIYHKICRFLLEILERFVFDISPCKDLELENICILENFILKDSISFRDEYHKNIVNKIKNRKKLRVENYIIFRGDALINGLDYMFKSENKYLEELNSIVTDASLINVFDKFNPDILEEDKKGTFSMLLLYYLENNYENINPDLILKIEQFIIYNFPNNIELTENQKRTYNSIKSDYTEKLSSFILENYELIKKHLKDFDTINKFKKNGNYKIIEAKEKKNDLPELITKHQLEKELLFFITEVFMLNNNYPKENIPIFQESMEMERMLAIELALEYLTRFIYINSSYENDKINFLEELIYNESTNLKDSKLCLTKSKLMSNVSQRRAKENYSK